MEIYIFAYFILLYNMLVLKSVKIVQIVLLVIIAFVIGFRGIDIGTDTITYYDMYDSLGINGYEGYPEPLYGLSCVFTNWLGLTFSWHQSLLCGFSFIFVYKALKKSENMGMSLFIILTLYFYCYTMNIYSQLIACYIWLYAFTFLSKTEKKDRIIFLLLVGLAMGFHLSALFLLPLMFVEKLKLSNSVVYLGLIVSFVLGVIDLTGMLASYLMDYARHLDRTVDTMRIIQGIVLSFYWMLAFLFLYNSSDVSLRNRMELKIFFIGVLVYNFFLTKDLATRFMLYFSIPLILWLPSFCCSDSKKKFFRQLVLIVYTSVYYYTLLFLNSGDVAPYSIMQEQY